MSFQEQVKVKVNTSSPDGYHSKPSIAENLVHSGCIFMDSRLQSLS